MEVETQMRQWVLKEIFIFTLYWEYHKKDAGIFKGPLNRYHLSCGLILVINNITYMTFFN